MDRGPWTVDRGPCPFDDICSRQVGQRLGMASRRQQINCKHGDFNTESIVCFSVSVALLNAQSISQYPNDIAGSHNCFALLSSLGSTMAHEKLYCQTFRNQAVENQKLTDRMDQTVGLACAPFHRTALSPYRITLSCAALSRHCEGNIHASFPCESSKIRAKIISFGCKE